MSDDAVIALGRRAGLAIAWRDYANKPHRVAPDSIRGILSAMGLPCDTEQDLAHSRCQLKLSGLPPLLTATAGEPIDLPIAAEQARRPMRVTAEDGTAIQAELRTNGRRAQLTSIETPGYHSLDIGEQRTILAVAPPRAFTIADAAPNERIWGLAVQAYGLRRTGDCGSGDMAGVVEIARQAAALKADAVALSPLHALFAADPSLFSPYAPSSRLFYNPLYADPRALFVEDRVRKAAAKAGVAAQGTALSQAAMIDWPATAAVKMAIFRRLFDDFCSTDLSRTSALAAQFTEFRKARGSQLEDHAVFEALQGARVAADPAAWNWHDWPAPWRDPRGDAVKRFAREHEADVLFHCFLQWIADTSLAAAKQDTKQIGMRIGLIGDLAVGISGSGSEAWTNQEDVLGGLEIGAPPDLYNQKGQNWGLTSFSPRALRARGFKTFINTLRACLRHFGGLRIDHVMGMMRLWVMPHGGAPQDGAYLAYPLDDLLRLIALESHRHRAIVVGEDLGTVPTGFRDRLTRAGISGMRVLWFERRGRNFIQPPHWSTGALTMTSTHDLPTVAGWWSGRDIETRQELHLVTDAAKETADRQTDRQSLWRALQRAEAADGKMPPSSEPQRVVDAAAKFIAETRSQLALLPLEDTLGLEDQPNLPGTIDEHPNWRRRYPGQAADLLDAPDIQRRLAPLARREAR